MKKFDDLCQENYDRIYKYIYLKLQNKERTEDAVQTVFLIAYEKGRTFTKHPNPTAFLYCTAKNVVYDSVREMKKHGDELLEDTLHGKYNDLYEEIEHQEDQKIDEGDYIDQVLEQLTEEKRKLYDAYYVHGKSMDEIAKEYNSSSVTIRMRYVRLRKEMKHTIKNIFDNGVLP